MNMIQSVPADVDDKIDSRIIKEDYRNYDLVARYWEFGYRGKIWKHRKGIEEIDALDGQGIDELLISMREYVDDLIDVACKARKNKPPTDEDLLLAFKALEHKIGSAERQILKVHAANADAIISIEKAQRIGDYPVPGSVTSLYMSLARRLCDEVPYRPAQSRGKDGALGVLLADTLEQGSILVMAPLAQAALNRIEW
jgi:hypothetical protein